MTSGSFKHSIGNGGHFVGFNVKLKVKNSAWKVVVNNILLYFVLAEKLDDAIS